MSHQPQQNEALQFDGRTINSLDDVLKMLGWNSIIVFEASEHIDGDRLKKNKATIFVVLSDPYPEYKEFVFIDGDYHHTGDLLSMEYEGWFEETLNDYGKAQILPLSDVEFINRDNSGIPRFDESSFEQAVENAD